MKRVYFSGVHGVGKSTLIGHIAKELEGAGMSVYVFPEMSYIPDIPIGTMQFQLWFRKQVEFREKLLENVGNEFDFILLDREILDINVYTQRLLEQPIDMVANTCMACPDPKLHVVLTLNPTTVLERLNKRDEVHRRTWGEKDLDYITDINQRFEFQARSHDHIKLIANTVLEESIEEVLRGIF